MSKMHYILYIIAASSIFAFLIFVIDKIFAKFSFRRIPERVLLLSSFFGGAAGALAAMYLVRHKTRKKEICDRGAGDASFASYTYCSSSFSLNKNEELLFF